MTKEKSGTIGVVIGSERKVDNGVPVTDVQVDLHDGDTTNAELFQQPGDDALPLPGDKALMQEAPGVGVQACVGFNDPGNQGQAGPGERRLYSRTQTGKVAADIWMKGDGSVHIEIHDLTARVFVKTPGPVVIDSPDIRLGNENASRRIACVGDMVIGQVHALCAAPGSPLAPNPAPVPGAGVPFTAQITSGCSRAKGV